ncbi:unnamed protein product, partial [Effrenium voratum]
MKPRGWHLRQVCLAACIVAASSAKVKWSPIGGLLHYFEAACSPACVEPNGRCVAGKCVCAAGFSGDACQALAKEVQASPDVLGALARAKASAEALASPEPATALDLAAERARRVAAFVKTPNAEELPPLAVRSLKEAIQASHTALLSAAAVKESEASGRAALAEETILQDSPLREAQGLMDSISRYMHPLDPLKHFTTTAGPNASALKPQKLEPGACVNDCSGHGSCSMGACRCAEGWAGEACDLVRCSKDCSGRGSCLDGQCACNAAFYGAACEFPRCKNDCSGHGYCDSGSCVCSGGFRGESCETREVAAPVPVAHRPEPEAAAPVLDTRKVQSIAPPSCPQDCNQRGRCELDGTCTCVSNYTGLACENHCPSACSGQGACTGGQCICFFGFGGVDCSLSMCCNGHGDCPIPGRQRNRLLRAWDLLPGHLQVPSQLGGSRLPAVRAPAPAARHGGPSVCLWRHGASGNLRRAERLAVTPWPADAMPQPAVEPKALGLMAMKARSGLPEAPDCNAPHGRWNDEVGACICTTPFHGERCEEKHCADWDGTEGGTECSGNGVCQQGKCFCLPG